MRKLREIITNKRKSEEIQKTADSAIEAKQMLDTILNRLDNLTPSKELTDQEEYQAVRQHLSMIINTGIQQ